MTSAETQRDKGMATAEALVAAGRELFARHGYDGASVRAITAAAGANLGAITYHFGSKRALYERVVGECVEALAERVIAAARGPGAPLDRAGAVVREFFDYILANPDMPHFLLQELAVGRLPPEAAIAALRRIQSALAALMAEGQEDGSIRAGNRVVMSIGMISQALHLSLIRLPLATFFGVDLADPVSREEVVEQTVAYVRGGLAARDGGEGR